MSSLANKNQMSESTHIDLISMNIIDLAKYKAQDIYSLSVLLIAAALHEDRALYSSILEQAALLLKNMADNERNAWLLGRLYYAAKLIREHSYAKLMQEQLIAILNSHNNLTLSTCNIDYAMYMWANLYAVSFDDERYYSVKSQLINDLVKLETAITQCSNEQEIISNIIWTEILALQAAAAAHDKIGFHSFLNKIKQISGHQNIIDALKAGLVRSDQSSDYPAWAIGITALAAVAIGDISLAYSLKGVLRDTLIEIDIWINKEGQRIDVQWKAKAEKLLGMLLLSRLDKLIPGTTNFGN